MLYIFNVLSFECCFGAHKYGNSFEWRGRDSVIKMSRQCKCIECIVHWAIGSHFPASGCHFTAKYHFGICTFDFCWHQIFQMWHCLSIQSSWRRLFTLSIFSPLFFAPIFIHVQSMFFMIMIVIVTRTRAKHQHQVCVCVCKCVYICCGCVNARASASHQRCDKCLCGAVH